VFFRDYVIKIRGRDLHMRKTILALLTAGAFVGTALPASAQRYGDSDNYDDQPYRYHNYDYYRPHYRRYDYDRYRPYREHEHHWWRRWRHHHHDDYDRPYYRRYD
jgi:hypothetical protein